MKRRFELRALHHNDQQGADVASTGGSRALTSLSSIEMSSRMIWAIIRAIVASYAHSTPLVAVNKSVFFQNLNDHPFLLFFRGKLRLLHIYEWVEVVTQQEQFRIKNVKVGGFTLFFCAFMVKTIWFLFGLPYQAEGAKCQRLL